MLGQEETNLNQKETSQNDDNAIIIEPNDNNATDYHPDDIQSQIQLTGIEGLPHHLLSEMKTNIGVTVEELSRKHIVLLIFLRYFGCVFCQKSVVQIVSCLSNLIKLNCVPVFVHQESKEEADEFFSEKGMPKPLIKLEKKEDKEITVNNQALTSETVSVTFEKSARSKLMKQFLRVEDPEGTYYYKQFGVVPSATKMVTFTSTLDAFKLSLTEGYKLTPDASKKADRDQLAGSFIVAHGRIVNQFVTHSASKIPDFLELLLDVEGKGSDNLFDLLSISDDSSTNDEESIDKEEIVPEFVETSQVNLVERKNMKKLLQNYPMARKLASLPKEVMKMKDKRSFSCTSAQIDLSCTISLEESLINPQYRKVFKLFAAKIYAIESLLFWEHATAYQKLKTLKKRRQLAQYIIDTYLNSDSMLEINISSAMKKRVLSTFEKEGAIPELFDDVKVSMEGDAIKDSFLRFVESELYDQRIRKAK
ncbi:G protein signaling regulator [Naegleria gruberi]|uniref:G protein signaling regulator n=1 Tax=Naegleria gruberi TaxID=5762 RepID=D2VNL1_NAEGR|nr:G protein signaling regulator [Naegleria gruberi]EFC41756.1 G protein signaling regulator [Naegleria gruberi]|eukprot:XP_002674500.1 G protein signaling regulator [Naegleria gruberi strain NEG-M]